MKMNRLGLVGIL